MTSKLWVVTFFVLTALFSFCIVIWNLIFDPFSQLRDNGVYLVSSDYHRYVNAGLLKNNHDYNALVLGSSYIANFNNDLIDRLFDVKSQTISIYGASQKEISTTLAYALSKNPSLKVVFLDMSIWNVCNMTSHPVLGFPEGIYRDSYVDIIKYLFSFDIAFLSLKKLLFMLEYSNSDYSTSIRSIHPWYESYKNNFGNKEILQNELGNPPMATELTEKQIQETALQVLDCFQKNVLSVINKYPKVTFYLFNPPNFQWCLWSRYTNGSLVGLIRAEELIAHDLTSRPNIKFYDFYAAKEIVNDCKKFRDFGHFDLISGDHLVSYLKEGRFMRTPFTNATLTEQIKENLQQRVACPLE